MQQLDSTLLGEVNLIRYDKCSARVPDTTMQVFRHACDAHVNPVLALYNHDKERLRCKAVRAFNRIMDIADEDQDGALNDDELNQFHEFCFGRPLADELNDLKQVSCHIPLPFHGTALEFSHMYCHILLFVTECRSIPVLPPPSRFAVGFWRVDGNCTCSLLQSYAPVVPACLAGTDGEVA